MNICIYIYNVIMFRLRNAILATLDDEAALVHVEAAAIQQDVLIHMYIYII